MDENMIVTEVAEEELFDEVVLKKPISIACVVTFALSIASLVLAILSLFLGMEALIVPGFVVTAVATLSSIWSTQDADKKDQALAPLGIIGIFACAFSIAFILVAYCF